MLKILIPIFVVAITIVVFWAFMKPLGMNFGLRTYWPAFIAIYFFTRYQMEIHAKEH
jgi:hypothetical protein